MRKITLSLLLIVALSFSSNIYSQTAPDFTVTTVEGESINLYDLLNAGQYVLIDFTWTT